MKILITGATGFIGSHLTRALALQGHLLTCLVRKTSEYNFLTTLGAELVYGDVTDEASLVSIPSCDIIFHCAATVVSNNLRQLRACNVRGTEHVCRLARRMAVRRLVYVSSVAVVSGNPEPVLTDTMPYAATNNYGISKIEAEKIVLDFRRAGLPCAIIRPPMVYGEEEPHAQDKVFFLLAHRLLPLLDKGERLVHMGYVKNVAAALLVAMEAPELLNGTFFCADRDALTAREAFGILAASLGAPAPPLLSRSLSSVLARLPAVGNTIRSFRKDRVYDTGRILSAGYADVTAAREALALTGRWWRQRKGVPRE
jgi:nucleoside-diphosphate-sugar epimerase